VEDTWIGELNPHTRIRKNPAYSHDLWNKYKAVLDGDHRTNNIVEGFNHGFSLSLPSRTTEWSVIERFKVEEAMAKVALYQAAMGNTGQSHNTSMNLKHQDCEEKLRSVMSNFSNMSVQSYTAAWRERFDFLLLAIDFKCLQYTVNSCAFTRTIEWTKLRLFRKKEKGQTLLWEREERKG
jgi:hypothetical protein